MKEFFDVIVVGGGHAGCEAAMAAANMGSSVLLVSMDSLAFAKMSCNPAVGGIAKGQIVREIDALGGYTGIVTDRSTLQFRMLNRSKGPAMWSPRAQCDKLLFSDNWKNILVSNCNLSIYEGLATSFLIENQKIKGVCTADGRKFKSQALVLTAGTFLGGKLFIGRQQLVGGRIGEQSSYGLTEQLKSLGLSTDRMKTGTPPRIDITSVDTSTLPVQEGDENPCRFSFLEEKSRVQESGKQLPCYVLHTNEEVHEILRSGFSESPLFTGLIHGRGPRYCPSIEDKLRVFPENNAHQLFLEPEGENINEYYLQGFSSSLPYHIQISALHKIKGLENARVYRPAYAVEYDFFDPTGLKSNLESRVIENLFLAGQVNGTTGYEEAAAQGLMAGINAHLKINGKEPFVLGRDEAYIGVLIDDLITKGVDEPYRMFTSRAEYRILLRQDNADFRLTEKSYNIGLADAGRLSLVKSKQAAVNALEELIENSKIKNYGKASEYLKRPDVSISDVLAQIPSSHFDRYGVNLLIDAEVMESVEISGKYSGYIEREKRIASKIKKLEELTIPESFDFDKVSGLTIECRQKLKKYHPSTIAQASRISGVSPADISVLLIYFGR